MTSTTRCGECNAAIPLPVDLEALKMRCGYCGHEQPVPDLEARRKLLLEHQREARLAEQQRLAHEREVAAQAAAQRERHEDRKEAKKSRNWGRITSLFAMLLAPVIISVVVFDLPARLGFGDSGSGRLDLVVQQLTSTGCKVVEPVTSEYTSANVTALFDANACIRVLAAGGSGHSTLGLKLYVADGKEVMAVDSMPDPQLSFCTPTPTKLRYSIIVGPASKGRLSHAVLDCPAPAKAATPPPSPPHKR